MPAKFLVMLTQVRPLDHQGQVRDERVDPELVLESVATDEQASTLVLFTSLCGLKRVKVGEQRPKLVALPGSDTANASPKWGAPLLTRAGTRSGPAS